MPEVSSEINNFTHCIVFTFLHKFIICIMLKAYFVLTFYNAIYCTAQHHRIVLYKYGAIEINKHLHM